MKRNQYKRIVAIALLLGLAPYASAAQNNSGYLGLLGKAIAGIAILGAGYCTYSYFNQPQKIAADAPQQQAAQRVDLAPAAQPQVAAPAAAPLSFNQALPAAQAGQGQELRARTDQEQLDLAVALSLQDHEAQEEASRREKIRLDGAQAHYASAASAAQVDQGQASATRRDREQLEQALAISLQDPLEIAQAASLETLRREEAKRKAVDRKSREDKRRIDAQKAAKSQPDRVIVEAPECCVCFNKTQDLAQSNPLKKTSCGHYICKNDANEIEKRAQVFYLHWQDKGWRRRYEASPDFHGWPEKIREHGICPFCRHDPLTVENTQLSAGK